MLSPIIYVHKFVACLLSYMFTRLPHGMHVDMVVICLALYPHGMHVDMVVICLAPYPHGMHVHIVVICLAPYPHGMHVHMVVICLALYPTHLKLTCHHINRRHFCFNIKSISVHPLLWMNVMLDFICMVFAGIWTTFHYRKFKNDNVCRRREANPRPIAF